MKKLRILFTLIPILIFFTCFESLLAQTGTCQILGRRQIDQTLSSTRICTSTTQVSSTSQYLVAKMVGVNTINANLYLEKQASTGYTIVATRATASTSTENMDLTGLAVGYYRVCAQRGASTGSGTIHVTFDVVTPECGTGRDTCFGGVGKNCDGGVNGTCNGTTSDGLKQCQVAIGSQMHDTCCSSNPNGNNCGGNNSSTACKKEWDHAVNDTVSPDRNWTVTFNPTVVTYRGSSQSKITENFTVSGTSHYTSRPLAGAFKAPVGEKIWDIDAIQGWCVNPSAWTKYCLGACWATCN